MKKIFKALGYIAGGLVVLIISGFIFFNATYPKFDPPSNIKVEITPERIARGEYLANHVMVCMDCHSQRDWTKYSGPIKPASVGGGGDVWDENIGFPGRMSMKNITPASVGNWSDGELIRAITCGVRKNNEALFPAMPYPVYNQLIDEDLFSIIAYLRSLKPIDNSVPETELNFPLNFIVKTMPIRGRSPMKFDSKNSVEYGKYLTLIAGCQGCHSKSEKGEPIAGMEYGGGEEFPLPFGTIRSANITPDNGTGIGSWSKETFIIKFKSFASDSAKNISVSQGDFNTVMPWTLFSGMREEDLSAIYDYLRTVKPVHNLVQRFSPNNLTKK